jgi:hypothetical protein
VNRLLAEQIVRAIDSADRASIEFIPDAIGKRYIRKNNLLVEDAISMRRDQRKSLFVSALAVRLDEQLAPIGSPIQVFVKDISPSGLGFFHTRHWPSCHLAIRLPNPRCEDVYVYVVGTVRRSICKSGSYEVGIEFIHTFRTDRLDSLPSADAEPKPIDQLPSEAAIASSSTSPTSS